MNTLNLKPNHSRGLFFPSLVYTRFLTVLLLAALLFFTAQTYVWAQFFPQINWTAPQTLAPGVTYQHGSHATGRELELNLITVDLASTTVEVRPLLPPGWAVGNYTRATPTQLCSFYGAFAVVNGGFFDIGGNGQPLGYRCVDGFTLARVVVTRPPRTCFLQPQGAAPRFERVQNGATRMETLSGFDLHGLVHGLGAGPRLYGAGVDVSVAAIIQEQMVEAGTNPYGYEPRTALGLTPSGLLLILTIDGRQPGWSNGATMQEVGQILYDLGATDSMCLDGGGSTAMATGTGTVGYALLRNRPSDGIERPVSEGLAAMPRSAEPVIAPITVDNADLGFTASGTWESISNPAWFGVNYQVGLTVDASWNATLPVAGLWCVSVTWSAHSNRATAVPFTVQHDYGQASFYVDQTQQPGGWYPLGGPGQTFHFNPGSPAVVTLVNSGSGYNVADAVRFDLVLPDEPPTAVHAAWMYYQ